MFGLKSTVINATLAATFAIPVATAGMFASAGSAQAAALTGALQIKAGTTISPFASSNVTLSKDALTFNPQPITPIALEEDVNKPSGSLSNFNTANIGNIISFSEKNWDNPFMDLGNLNLPGIILPGEDTSSITDNQNTFTLTSSYYSLNNSGFNVAIDVVLEGFFTSATGEISKGAGNLTFQANDMTVEKVNTLFSGGGSLKNLFFTGATFATVPEPATMLGLGLVGVGMAVSRRRKTAAN
jgi:hypothetical protein